MRPTPGPLTLVDVDSVGGTLNVRLTVSTDADGLNEFVALGAFRWRRTQPAPSRHRISNDSRRCMTNLGRQQHEPLVDIQRGKPWL
jgi:hypothetical protein